jgi:hypothetical protein
LNATLKPALIKLSKVDYRSFNGTNLLLKKEGNQKKAVNLAVNSKIAH